MDVRAGPLIDKAPPFPSFRLSSIKTLDRFTLPVFLMVMVYVITSLAPLIPSPLSVTDAVLETVSYTHLTLPTNREV